MVELKFFALVVLSVAAAPPVAAQWPPDAPLPVQQFLTRLERANTICFTAKDWRPDPTDFEGKSGVKWLMATFRVKIQRPDHISILSTPSLERERSEDGHILHDFFGNGDSVIATNTRSLILNETIQRYRFGAPAAKLLKNGYSPAAWIDLSDLLSKDPLDGYKRSEVFEAGFPRGYAIAFSVSDMQNSDVADRLLFNAQTGELIRFARAYRDPTGKWQDHAWIEYRDWDFDAKLARSTFDTRPPRGYSPWPTKTDTSPETNRAKP